MNASRFSLAAALVALTATSMVHAVVPPVDGKGKGAVIRCGTGPNGAVIQAFHADKIIFRITGFLAAEVAEDQQALNQVPRNTELDIKVIDNPRTVADLKGKVLTFLGAADKPEYRDAIAILEVKYAMVCPTTTGP